MPSGVREEAGGGDSGRGGIQRPIKRGLHWIHWIDAGVTRYGIGYISGKFPFLMIEILIELELLKAKRDLKVFVLDPSHLVEYKKLEVDWEIAPDRILRMFDQPLRKGTAK